MIRLDNTFARDRFTVTVVGCGGTGSFVVEGLCRILPERATLVLVDPDRVEERNLLRQNFTREDLGRFKSEVLAARLARRHGRPVAYSVLPVGAVELRFPGVVVGCVDNGLARRDIASKMRSSFFANSHTRRPNWWVDAGNGEDYGQIVIGSGEEVFDEEECVCHGLPLPTTQRPELLLQVPAQRTCADMDEQGPVINQVMAALVVEVVRRLVEGTCPWKQLYFDLKAGILTPIMAEPRERRER